MTLATELDGTYTVTSLTSYDGPLRKQSDGITEIKNGQTERVDEAGCEWRSTFEWVDDETVKMISVADPTNASPDFMLTTPSGQPTSEAQTYETTLTVKRKGEKVQLTGTITYGHETIFLTMRKIA